MTHRKKGSWLLPRKAMDLILRGNIGPCSLRQLSVFAIDLEHGSLPQPSTLSSWEIKLGTSLVASSVGFHRTNEQWFLSAPSTGHAFHFGRIRCDGSNTIKNKSFHTLECDSLYCVNSETDHSNVWPAVLVIHKHLKTPMALGA